MSGTQVVRLPSSLAEKPKRGRFGGGRSALEEENAELRSALAAFGATEKAEIEADLIRLRAEHQSQMSRQQAELGRAQQELAQLREQIVVAQEEAMLQEIGIYEYQHPLDSAVAYKARLVALQARIKQAAKSGGAVGGATNWQDNRSAREGARMVKDFSKLMLRAYNNEAESAVRSLKPHTLTAAIDRLDKSRATISKLGTTMTIEILADYHQMRIEELKLSADYLARAAEETEGEREARALLRDEEKAQRELERERAKLVKEAAHYASAIEAMRGNGDESGAAEAEAKLAEINNALEGVVDLRSASESSRAGSAMVPGSHLGAS